MRRCWLFTALAVAALAACDAGASDPFWDEAAQDDRAAGAAALAGDKRVAVRACQAP